MARSHISDWVKIPTLTDFQGFVGLTISKLKFFSSWGEVYIMTLVSICGSYDTKTVKDEYKETNRQT